MSTKKHEPYSRISVETRDEDGTVDGRTSGTTGAIDLGTDLAYVLDCVPRVLEVLARAICVTYDRVKDKSPPPALLKAAMEYAGQWREYDKFVSENPKADVEEILKRCPK